MLNHLRSPERRYARRMARIARWDRPLETDGARLGAWLNMIFADHGIFRLAYLNAHPVTPMLWRAAQPAPHQIAAFARKGVRTLLTLRGGREHGGWPLEREACARHGLALREFTMRSREAPDREALLALPEFLATLEGPVLVHCKSGADRAGLFAALYLLIAEKAPVAIATRQLSWRFGHLNWGKTGILDAFLAAYQAEGEAKGLGFLEWVRDVYDPAALTARYKSGPIGDFVVDTVLHRE